MTAALARRVGAAALTATLSAGVMFLTTGSAAAQTPRQLTCTLDLNRLPAPVAVQPGERVQLVLVVPLLGTRVNVGPSQTVPTSPGEALVQGTVSGVVGLVGQLCGVLVTVQNVVTSAVPIPPIVVPTLPPLLPSVTVPVPGVDLGVQPPPATNPPPGSTPPGSTPPTQPDGAGPPTAGPDTPAPTPGYRFPPGSRSMYDFSRMPYGIGTRFGPGAAPAFRFGQQLPGYAPQFGVLDDEVADAGEVRALPLGGPGAVALPVLLAVLMLSAVAGALVRTWALRRTV
jgi:hypothetical protein